MSESSISEDSRARLRRRNTIMTQINRITKIEDTTMEGANTQEALTRQVEEHVDLPEMVRVEHVQTLQLKVPVVY